MVVSRQALMYKLYKPYILVYCICEPPQLVYTHTVYVYGIIVYIVGASLSCRLSTVQFAAYSNTYCHSFLILHSSKQNNVSSPHIQRDITRSALPRTCPARVY